MSNHFLESECKLLGAYMENADLFEKVSHLVFPEIFTTPATNKSYKIITKFHAAGVKPDILIIHAELKKAGIPHAECAIVSKFEYNWQTESQVEYLVKDLFDNYASKKLMPELQQSHSLLMESPQFMPDVLDKLKEVINKIELTLNNVSKEESSSKIFDKAVQRIIDLKNGVIPQSGFTWGLKNLDQKTGGINKGVNIIAAFPGEGKCLGRGTKIVMFDGALKEVQDIVVGDKIMGIDSTPRTVLSLAKGQEMMYWVKQKQGINYRCNESHVLSLKASHNNIYHKNGDVINISIKDYLKLKNHQQVNLKGYKTGVEFTEQEVEIDPYFIGLWLGDGTASKPEITTPDKEIVDYLYSFANSIGQVIFVGDYKIKDKCPRYSLSKGHKTGPKNAYCLYSHLKKLNLLNNKHIPQNYLINSTEKRLRLLAGLLDTDGYLYHGSYEIIQKCDNLSRQIKFLADSLGFKTSITKKAGTIKSRNFKGVYNKIMISGNVNIIPLKIKRKIAHEGNKNKNWKVTGIEVVPDGMGDYYGFTLDKDGLFLLEDFTVTHNTTKIVSIIRANAIDNNVPVLFFSAEMDSVEIMTNIISNVTELNSRALRSGDVDDGNLLSINSIKSRIKDNLVIDDTGGITWQYVEAKIRAFKKKHSIKEPLLVLIDYLQIMSNTPDELKTLSEEGQVAKRCNELARICKTENISLVLLSQFSREAAKRDSEPRMQDLKGSAAIEACAILILILYRPDYHGIFEEGGVNLRGLCRITPVKGRYVKLEPVYARFLGKYSKFLDYNIEEQSTGPAF